MERFGDKVIHAKIEIMQSILSTKRMSLRELNEDDLENLKALHFDGEVMRFLGGGQRFTLEEVKKDLANYLEHQKEHGFSKWAVINNETLEFMGRAGFYIVPETGEIDLGYAFHQKFWSQGYGRELAQELVDYALTRWPKEKIVGLISEGNEVSAKILEKVGFCFVKKSVYFGMPFLVYKLKLTN